MALAAYGFVEAGKWELEDTLGASCAAQYRGPQAA